ncbi:MAG: hypothetical protein KAJ14_12170 [Candidatus Omnitrophica bacterium]|nr:hypothetical protein [Candidatus Omnitrophota bacterium]
MKIGNYKERVKKELNKWYLLLEYSRAFEYVDKRAFRFGVFNFRKFPQECEAISGKHYKGFIFIRQFRHPLTIIKQYLESKNY